MSKEVFIHIDSTDNKRYYADCEMTILHRTDGPAIEWADGYKEWRMHGQRHRVDGPAIEWADGYKEWWIHGNRHRVDGPAVEYASGTKAWYLNGKLHRTDGPAIEGADGGKQWYLNGVKHTEEEFDAITHPQPVELTLDQIAAKFNIDVKNLKIVK